jgi:hypothetical protein
MGRAAVELVLEELRKPGLTPRSLVLPAPLAQEEPPATAAQPANERHP